MDQGFLHLHKAGLEAKNLAVFRGERLVFKDISFHLPSGTALLLRGPNGSGKSSLLRAVAGLTPLAAGTLLWNGENAFDDLPTHATRLAWLGHQDAVKPALTPAEHVPLPALEAVSLAGYAHLPAKFLSAGQKRRLALARIIASQAPLWLLDEPTNGLDTASITQFESHAAAHLATGGQILASTHTPLSLPSATTLDLSP